MSARRALPLRTTATSLAGVALLSLLGGCVVGPDWRAINIQAAQIRAGCENQHAAGTIKTALATEQCANPSIHNLYASIGFPDLDVIDAYLAKRESIAALEDRHAISPEEARSQLAQALVEQNSTFQQRAANRAVAYAAAYSAFPGYCSRISPGTLICN